MELDVDSNVSCHGSNDGSALVIASGHAPYTYTWVGTNSSFVSYTDSIFGLSAGTYSVTVTDTNNCTRNSSVDIYEPLPIVYNVSTSADESCLGAVMERFILILLQEEHLLMLVCLHPTQQER